MIDVWSFWGCVGSIFSRLGASWGGLLDVLEGLGRLLGGLEAVLDRSWAALSRHGSFRVVLEPAGSGDPRHLGSQRGAKMRSKWDPRRTKIDVKNDVEKRCS